MGADWDPSNRYLALSWLHFHDPVINYLVLEKEERPSSRTDFIAANETQSSPDLSTAISDSKLTHSLSSSCMTTDEQRYDKKCKNLGLKPMHHARYAVCAIGHAMTDSKHP